MGIEFYGYNDLNAIAIYNSLKIFKIFLVSFFVSIFTIPFAIVYSIYELLYIFIIPSFFLLLFLIIYLISYKSKNLLGNQKNRHKFRLESGYLFKDNKEIKNHYDIKIYKFKKFLFLRIQKSYYMIKNDDYIQGSRDEFLNLCIFNNQKRHLVSFELPKKSEEEIIEFLFNNEINELKEDITYYSKDKRKIITICKNNIGSYTSHRYVIDLIDDDNRMYYGCYVPDINERISYYGTIEEAFNDVKGEIKDYIELK